MRLPPYITLRPNSGHYHMSRRQEKKIIGKQKPHRPPTTVRNTLNSGLTVVGFC